MAAIKRFLNPASTGGDGTTNALTGAQAAYATHAAFDSAEAKDLTTPNDDFELESAGGELTEVYKTQSGSWVTDAVNFVRYTVEEASRHDGTPGTGFRMTGSDSFDGVFEANLDGTVVEFYEATNTSVGGSAAGFVTGADDVIFYACIGQGGDGK